MSVEVIETTDGRASAATSEKDGRFPAAIARVGAPCGGFWARVSGVQFVELASTTPKMIAPAMRAKKESCLFALAFIKFFPLPFKGAQF